MKLKVVRLRKRKAKSGFLVEFLKNSELGPSKKKFALIYVVNISPGAISGNHFHKEKSEWMTVFNGKVRVAFVDIKTKERKEFSLDPSKKLLTKVFIKTGIAHAIKNISGSNVVLVAYADKIYDPKKPDTYNYTVL